MARPIVVPMPSAAAAVWSSAVMPVARRKTSIEPKIAVETVTSEFLAVDPGFVCGIIQDGVGYRNGEPIITLHMEAYLGAPETYDAVDITGSPALFFTVA